MDRSATTIGTVGAVIKGFIRDGRVEIIGPIDLPDRSEVAIAPWTSGPDDGPASAEEIARVLAAMHRLEPLDIPEEVGADLDAWERDSSTGPRA